MEQTYRVNFKLRRRGQSALEQNRHELRTEDYDNDEEFCMAVASELMEMLNSDRDYLSEHEVD